MIIKKTLVECYVDIVEVASSILAMPTIRFLLLMFINLIKKKY